jgi:hypothetical protein
MLLCVFTMVIACGVFGYSINLVGVIISDFTSFSTEIKKNARIINNYMQKK